MNLIWSYTLFLVLQKESKGYTHAEISLILAAPTVCVYLKKHSYQIVL